MSRRLLRPLFGLVLLAAPVGAQAAEGGLAGSYLAGRHAANLMDVAAASDYFTAALARDPDNAELMERALLFRLSRGDRDATADLAARLDEADPGNSVAVLALVVEDFAEDRLTAAEVRLGGPNEKIHPLLAELLRAWASFGAGDLPAAEVTLGQLGDRPAFKLFSAYHSGLMRAASGDAEGAVERLAEAAAAAARAPSRLVRAQAAAMVASGDVEGATALVNDALAGVLGDAALEEAAADLAAGRALAPLVTNAAEGAAESLHGLAGALAQENGRAASLLYAQLALSLRPDFTEASLLLAELLGEQGQHELAAEAYAAVPEDSPFSRAAEIGRAEAIRSLGDEDAAVAALQALTRRAPEAADAQLALADLMRRLERWEEGADAYSAALDLLEGDQQRNWVLHYQRGVCYERAGLWSLAEADFKAALEIQPNQPLVLNYLGYSWVEMGINLDEAREMIAQAVALRPQDGFITDSLGWVLYKTGDFEGAAPLLERAVELQPVDPIINDHFGDALWMVGRKLEARFQWRRALSFDPEDADRARIKRKLDVGLDVVLREESEGAVATDEAAPAPDGDGG